MNRFALSLVLLLSGLGLTVPPAAEADLPPLRPLSKPVLEMMSEPVRDQILRQQAKVERLLAAPETAAADAAESLGDLGGLYVLYGLMTNAVEALENAGTLDPTDFRWPYLLGFTHQTEGRLESAVDAYREALSLRSEFVPALLRLGTTLVDLGRSSEAAPLFDRALELQPGTAAAHYGRARIAQAAGDDRAAVDDFERALELQPQASAVRFPLAQSLRRLGRLDEAEVQLAAYGTTQISIPDPVIRRLRALGTGSAVHAVRGQRALDQGDLDTAVAEFRLAREADPDNAPVRRALALALRQRGELEAAIAEYRGTVELEPANPINHQDLALALSEQDRLGEAIVHFRRAIALSPDYRESHLGLGIALARLGSFEEALVHLDRASALDPSDPAPRYERAVALLRLARSADAREAFEEVLESTPDHAAALLGLARLLELEGDLEGADRHLRAGLDAEPSRALAALLRLARGRIAERAGADSVALEHYTAALESDGDLLPARLRRASLLAAGGDLAGAAREYEAVLGTTPDAIPTRLAGVTAWILVGEEGRAMRLLEEGLAREPRSPHLAATLALLHAAGSDESVRRPDRARELARQAFSALNDRWSGEILAVSLAANGLFEEAARAQERLIAASDGRLTPDELAAASRRLEAYRRQLSPSAPWREDPSLLPPPLLPLPAIDSEAAGRSAESLHRPPRPAAWR